MPDVPFITVADAIVAELNAAVAAEEFSQSFDAEVVWANRDIEQDVEGDRLRVDVGPSSWGETLAARGSWDQNCHYWIVVRKNLHGIYPKDPETGQPAHDEIKALVNVVAELVRFFMPLQPDKTGRELADVPEAAWVAEKENTTEVTIMWEHLRVNKQFVAFFPLSYEVSD